MNRYLAEMMEQVVPKFNPHIANGLATSWVKTSMEYINDIILSNMKSAPKELTYEGLRKVSAKEEFHILNRNQNVKTSYDMARYDVYRIELLFKYEDVPIPNRYLYLPFVDEGGILSITDTKYHIIPVLSDTVITPTYKNVFVRLLRAKLLFNRINRNIIKNGKILTGEVIYSDTIKTDTRELKDNLGKVVAPIAIYTFAEMGFKAGIKKYLNLDIIIDKNGSRLDEFRNEYDVYTTTKLKVRQLKQTYYHPHDIHIYVKKGNTSVLLENTITAIIYTFDVLPDYAEEMVNIINSDNINREKKYWKIILGTIIFKNSYSIDRAFNDVNDHFIALKSYIDNLIKKKLAETGMDVNNFFDLINIILANYNMWLLDSKGFNNNLDNRYLDILYYVLYPIIIGINKMTYEISKKAAKKKLTHGEVTSIMNNHLKLREFFKIKKGDGVSLALMLLEIPNDSKYFKVSSLLSLQELGNGVTKAPGAFPESLRFITGSDLYLGSVLNLPKSTPTPKVRINPWLDINIDNGRININRKDRSTINKIDKLLQGKITEDMELPIDDIDIDIE